MTFSVIVALTFLALSTSAYQFPSSSGSSVNLPPSELLEDLRRIAEKITGDPENLDRLSQQLKDISTNNQNLAKMIEAQMNKQKPSGDSNRLVQESSLAGSNPLVSIQSRINLFFESMSQLFARMRSVFERVQVPSGDDLNPLKALQSLEAQFHSMVDRFRQNNPLFGSDRTSSTTTPSSETHY